MEEPRRIVHLKNPCHPGCPNRDSYCHVSCAVYARYVANRREICKERRMQSEADGVSADRHNRCRRFRDDG